ncbi:hypothetical protein VCRA2110O318_40068 [Vibrio crassostreae]|nr:hypothetical protein VCRA2117O328_40068 [Vibrio crassostreae]CAK2335651.1 hypothetical protein VCRA2110O318_40068 [Vibrio crassostreae]CAK2504206.1 hypothetical protein VCRA2110O319_50069 [Vibrio crassostreae]CAK2908552.1 hypothetical protein VCRA217O317_30224 [Vibrio crassostreae]
MPIKRGDTVTFQKHLDDEVKEFEGIVTTSRMKEGRYPILSYSYKRYTGESTALVKPENIKPS